jgi:hypothetical protein
MQNFGKIKNAFHDILAESIIDKDIEKRKIVKRYIRAISESKILKAQFLVYNNIESRVDENQFSANLFLTENINALKKFSREDIIAENKKLVNMSQMVKCRLNSIYDNMNLHESITSLIFVDTTPSNVKTITENRMMLVKYINENKERVIVESVDIVPNSLLADIAASKFNDKYANLSEDEHRVLKVILENNENGKEEVFNKTLSSCLKSVNEALKDTQHKDKLLDVKEKLLNTIYANESFSEDIVKLLDLKRTLTIE